MCLIDIYSGAKIWMPFSSPLFSLTLTPNKLSNHLDLLPNILESLHYYHYLLLLSSSWMRLSLSRTWKTTKDFPASTLVILYYLHCSQQSLTKLQIWALWSFAYKFLITSIASHCWYTSPLFWLTKAELHILYEFLFLESIVIWIFSLILYRKRNYAFLVDLFVSPMPRAQTQIHFCQ